MVIGPARRKSAQNLQNAAFDQVFAEHLDEAAELMSLTDNQV